MNYYELLNEGINTLQQSITLNKNMFLTPSSGYFDIVGNNEMFLDINNIENFCFNNTLDKTFLKLDSRLLDTIESIKFEVQSITTFENVKDICVKHDLDYDEVLDVFKNFINKLDQERLNAVPNVESYPLSTFLTDREVLKLHKVIIEYITREASSVSKVILNINNILNKNNENIADSGVDSLKIGIYSIQSIVDDELFSFPLFLQPVAIEFEKLNSQYKITRVDSMKINTFGLQKLAKSLNVDLDLDVIGSEDFKIDEILKYLEGKLNLKLINRFELKPYRAENKANFKTFFYDRIKSLNEELWLDLTPASNICHKTMILGLFSTKSYSTIARLEELSEMFNVNDDSTTQITVPPLLKELYDIGENNDCVVETPFNSELGTYINETSIRNVLPLDYSQSKVIERSLKQTSIIEGPPGTGKTHTIINLLSEIVARGQSALVVSEKYVALEVIYNKMSEIKELQDTVLFLAKYNDKKSIVHTLKRIMDINTEDEINLIGNDIDRFNLSNVSNNMVFNTLSIEKLNDYYSNSNFYFKHLKYIPLIINENELSTSQEIDELYSKSFSNHDYYSAMNEITKFEKNVYKIKELITDLPAEILDSSYQTILNSFEVLRDIDSVDSNEMPFLVYNTIYNSNKVRKSYFAFYKLFNKAKRVEYARDYVFFKESLSKLIDFITSNSLEFVFTNFKELSKYDVNTMYLGLTKLYNKNNEIVDKINNSLEMIKDNRSSVDDIYQAEITKNLKEISTAHQKAIEETLLKYRGKSELKRIRQISRNKGSFKGSLRQLFEDGKYDIIKGVSPIWLLNIDTLSHLLSTDNLDNKFDYIIFDEASQIDVYKPLFSLALAKKTIIVGDTKQLSPTNFFSRTVKDKAYTSLLELAGANISNSNNLEFHYRSVDHRLIEYSNQVFYESKLRCLTKKDLSDNYTPYQVINVEDAVWENNRNSREASKLVETLSTILVNHPNKSIGIVAMNQQQRDLIYSKISALRASDEDFDKLYSAIDSVTTIFVKNIENVQGDERDIIIISTTYGPDTNNKISARFGPINQENGPNRLNVLFTRAKYMNYIIKSIPTDRFPVTASEGTKIFKDYVKYCETSSYNNGEFSDLSTLNDIQKKVYDLINKYITDEYTVELNKVYGAYTVNFLVKKQGKVIATIVIDQTLSTWSKDIKELAYFADKYFKIFGHDLTVIYTWDIINNPNYIEETILNALN